MLVKSTLLTVTQVTLWHMRSGVAADRPSMPDVLRMWRSLQAEIEAKIGYPCEAFFFIPRRGFGVKALEPLVDRAVTFGYRQRQELAVWQTRRP